MRLKIAGPLKQIGFSRKIPALDDWERMVSHRTLQRSMPQTSVKGIGEGAVDLILINPSSGCSPPMVLISPLNPETPP